MRVFKKIAIAFALVLAICLPTILLAACDNGAKNKLSLEQAFKTEYYVGEELDVSGGILEYIDENGQATSVELLESMVSVFSTEKPGNRKLLITYKNGTLTINYTVKPWDVQDNEYYYDANTKLVLSFNRAQNEVIMFSAPDGDPDSVPEEQKKNGAFQMKKDFDQDGNIIYTYQVPTGRDDENATYTIFNITKESIKVSAANQEVTLKIYG